MATSAQAGGEQAAGSTHSNDTPHQTGSDVNPASRGERDTLARTGPLLILLVPVLGIFGLAALAGYLTDTGVLIVALVVLLLATTGVITAVIRMMAPPEDDEDGPGHPAH